MTGSTCLIVQTSVVDQSKCRSRLKHMLIFIKVKRVDDWEIAIEVTRLFCLPGIIVLCLRVYHCVI